MPQPDVLQFTVDDSEVQAMLASAPRYVNSEFQKAFRSIGGDFMRKFTRERLRKGVVQVHRRTARKVTRTPGESRNRRRIGADQISIPKKARAMGFRGDVFPSKQTRGKTLTIRSGSPVAKMHEYGGRIGPRAGRRWLYIPVKSKAALTRAGVKLRRGQQKPKVIRVKAVQMKPRLGFRRSWELYQTLVRPRLQKALERAEFAAKKKAERAAARATARARGAA